MKKNIALLSIWILLFATFGPIASVDAYIVNCHDCGFDGLFCSADQCIDLNDKREDLGLLGCVYDTELINECMNKESSIRECNTCGTGLFTKCGIAECEDIIGVQREAAGLAGCVYDTKWINECLAVDESEISNDERAERIEENGGMCFGPDKSTCVICQNTLSDLFDHCCETNYEYSIGYDVVRTKKKIEWKMSCQYDQEATSQYGTIDAFAKTGDEYISSYTVTEHLDLEVCRKEAVNRELSAVKCNVVNFNLPQKVGVAEEIILGAGDPDYIAYWQNFPQGEESSWESLVSWQSNIGILVLTALPLGVVFKGGKVVTKSAGEFATESTAKYSSKFVSNIKRILKFGNNLGDDAGKAVIQTNVRASNTYSRSAIRNSPEAVDGLMTQMMKGIPEYAGKSFNQLNDVQKKGLIGKIFKLKSGNTAKWAMITAGTGAVGVEAATLSAWFMDRTMSIAAKFEKHPQAMMLHMPFNIPQKITLGADTYSKMVVLDKPLMLDTQAYFASPCKANFVVEVGECSCNAESFRMIKGNTVVDKDGYTVVFTDDDGNNVPEIIFDNPETEGFDESTELDGAISCDMVTKGHDMWEKIKITFSGGGKVIWHSGPTIALSDIFTEDTLIGAKDKYFSRLTDDSEAIYTVYNEDQIHTVSCVRIKDTWYDESIDNNYCYASATGVGTAVLVGSIIADVIIIKSTAGLGTQFAVGVTAAALTYYATHATVWPGHEPRFWQSYW